MFQNLEADLRHYSRFCCGGGPLWKTVFRILYAHPASIAVIWYRFGHTAWTTRIPIVRQLMQLVYLLIMPLVRMYTGVQIQPQTTIGPGLAILHFGGVVITKRCTLGRNCLLYHNVSIVTMRSAQGPTIGDHFYAGVGATLIGTLAVEDHVTVGAGAVVTRSVPADAVVAGVPARILRFRQANEDPTENRTLPNHPGQWLSPPTARTTDHANRPDKSLLAATTN